MALYKHVSGIGNVQMTPEEEAAWLAESEANDPANLPQQEVEVSPLEKLTAFLRANPDVAELIEGQ